MKYQDFVIKKNKFIGEFDEMYKKISDPWNLLKKNKSNSNINYKIIFHYCDEIKNLYKSKNNKLTTLEIGCGYPQISYQLYRNKFNVFGTDISPTIIQKSKKKYPSIKKNLFVSDFLNLNLYDSLKPNILILSDISWYVLPQLKKFIYWFKNSNRKLFLIHTLAVYKKNKQKYGNDYFYDLNTIKKFFNLRYLSSGFFENDKNDTHTFFLAKNFI